MASITQRIPNFLGGVSKQPDSEKAHNEVVECNNAIPDPTFGLTKRPGSKWLKTLAYISPWLYKNAKWFLIHRDGDEKYLGCIAPSYLVVTSGGSGIDTTSLTNLSTTGGSGTGLTVDATLTGGAVTALEINQLGSGYDHNDVITVTVGGVSVTGKVQIDADPTNSASPIATWNISDEDDIQPVVTHSFVTIQTASRKYLYGLKENFDITTVQDTTIITNNNITVATAAATTDTTGKKATVVFNSLDGTLSATYSVTLGSDTVSAAAALTTGAAVLADLHTKIEALGSNVYTVEVTGLTLEIRKTDNSALPGITVTGGSDGRRLSSIVDTVQNISLLPTQCEHDRVVKILNSAADTDDYYVKFVANNSTRGEGYWEETLKPGETPGLDNTTMPHQLVNIAKNFHQFKVIDYTDRLVGDDVTNPDPSFVGKKINQTFYHNGRLGIISEDNVVLSRTLDEFNFYHKSAQTLLDSDPIDVSCSKTSSVVLHGVIPTAQGLTLFSEREQFLIKGRDGVLTPNAITVDSISHFLMDNKIPPVDIGDEIVYLNKTPTYSTVMGMVTKGQNENPAIRDISRKVKEWIPADITDVTVSTSHRLLMLYSNSSKDIYLYRTYVEGDNVILKTWYKWILPGTVESILVDGDDLVVVTHDIGMTTLSKISLTQSPKDSIIINREGRKINPRMDFYCRTSGTFGLPSASGHITPSGNDSLCWLPFALSPSSIAKPVVIVSGDSTGNTLDDRAGQIFHPEVVDVNGNGRVDYFKVKGVDLTSLASRVFVGLRYDYDITLPKIYFRSGDNATTDYTSKVTVSRVKFSTGLSGMVEFRVKSPALGQRIQSATGNLMSFDYQTYFFLPKHLKYEHKDQLKVKVNGVVKTDYTINEIYDTYNVLFNTQIVFGSALTASDIVIVYLDEWFDLQPVTSDLTYLADDTPLTEEDVFTLPIYQRPENFRLRVFSDSPYPLTLNSMMWEGTYSPRFYKRV